MMKIAIIPIRIPPIPPIVPIRIPSLRNILEISDLLAPHARRIPISLVRVIIEREIILIMESEPTKIITKLIMLKIPSK